MNWTLELVKKLRAAHDSAVRDKLIEFTFEGHEFLTSYARYLLEYLEPKFGIRKDADRG